MYDSFKMQIAPQTDVIGREINIRPPQTSVTELVKNEKKIETFHERKQALMKTREKSTKTYRGHFY